MQVRSFGIVALMWFKLICPVFFTQHIYTSIYIDVQCGDLGFQIGERILLPLICYVYRHHNKLSQLKKVVTLRIK